MKKNIKEPFGESLYSSVYALGDGYGHFFGSLFSAAGRTIKHFFVKTASLFVLMFSFFKKCFVRVFGVIKKEFAVTADEVKRARPTLNEAFKKKKSEGVSLFFKYVRKFFKSHRKFNFAIMRTVIPVLAVIVLVMFFVAFNNLTFALGVDIGNNNIGVARNESEYKKAETEAKKRFKSLTGDVDSFVPEYHFVLTTINRIDDTEKLCNNIIAAVSDSVVNACGIYVNGEFLCAVRSEDTFLRIKDEILSGYAQENGYVSDDTVVEFYDEITTVSGLYPENDKIWSAEKLKEYFGGEKTPTVTHITVDGETLEDILNKYNITEDKLKELNKELDPENIPAGSTLLISRGERNMKIKTTVTYTQVESIPYDTVSQFDNSIYIGTTLTIVEGEIGNDIVSYTDTYVDGELTDSKRERVRFNVGSPVNKLVRIGTKGIPVNNEDIPISPRLYRDQGGSFIWPAPDNCFWISQKYNPGNSHYGIDICSSDNGTCRGRRIVAVEDGVVVMATYHYSWGYYIRVDHGDGVVTGYAHALEGSFRVNVGDYVKQGQQLSSIGTTGNSTGYHLHFEVWLDGTRVDPLPYVHSYYIGVAVG